MLLGMVLSGMLNDIVCGLIAASCVHIQNQHVSRMEGPPSEEDVFIHHHMCAWRLCSIEELDEVIADLGYEADDWGPWLNVGDHVESRATW